MAISFVAAGAVVVGANPTVAVPAGFAAGDILLLTTTGTATPTTPAGWTQLYAQGAGQFLTILYKYATATEASVVLTLAGTTSKAVMVAYRGAGAFQTVPTILTGTSTAPSTNTLTTTYASDFVLSIYTNLSGAARTWTAPASTTARVNSATTTTAQGLLMVDETQAVAGTSTARTGTISVSSAWQGIQIALIPSRTVYWVGGNGTWATPGAGTTGVNWADSTGSTGGKIVPSQNDAVIIDASSGSPTVTLSGAPACASLTTTGATCTLSSTGTLSVAGGMTLSATTTWSATGLLTFLRTGTVTPNGVTINSPVTFNGVSQFFTLGSALTIATTQTTTFTNGTLSLGTFTLTTGLFNSSNSNTRVIQFGSSGVITCTGSGTVFDMTTATGFSFTTVANQPSVNISNNSAVATTVITGATVRDVSALQFRYTTGTYTLTDANAVYFAVNFTGFAGTVTNQTRTIAGGTWINPATGITWTGGDLATSFSTAAGAGQTITANGATLDFPINCGSGLDSTLSLGSAITTRSFFVGQCKLDLNNFTLTTGSFNSNTSSTRSILFGTTGEITCTGSGTVWSMDATTGFTYTGTSKVNISNNSATATTVIMIGATATNALNFNYTTGTYTLTDATAVYNNVNWTGFAGTVTNQTRSVCGNWTNPATGITWTAGALVTTFTGTTNTQILTHNAVTLDFPVSYIATGAGTLQLTGALTLGSTRTFSFTGLGTLNLNNFTLTAGQFNSSSSNTRVLAFGTTGVITCVGSGTIWNMTTVTGFTYTGTSTVNISNNSATATTVNTGALAAANTLNFNYTTGTYALTETVGRYLNLNFTGFAGTVGNATRIIYGNWTNPASGITWTGGANATSFSATAGTQTFAPPNVTLDFPITKNAASTLILSSGLSIGTTRTLTVSAGTFTPGFDIFAGLFNLTGGTVNMGSNYWYVTGTGVVWTRTSATINAGTSQILLTDATASALTFAGGGATYYGLNLSSTAGTGTVTFTGANTFNTLASSRTGIYTVTLPASTTTTVTTWNIAGTNATTNYFTLNSSSPGTQATLSVATGTVNPGFSKIQDIAATGGATFTAAQSANLGNNTGWTFPLGRYWVANNATWDNIDTTNWAFTSGGTPGAFPPTALDNVYFDGNSRGSQVTLSGALSVLSFDSTGSGNVFPASAGTLTVYGNFILGSGVGWAVTGAVTLAAPVSATINMQTGSYFLAPLIINGPGATFTLANTFNLNNTSLTLTAGTLVLNGFDVNCYTFSSNNSNTRQITFGSNYVNVVYPYAGTVLDITNATGFTPSGAGGFKVSGSSNPVTRTIVIGTTGGSVATAPNVIVTPSSDTIAITTGSWFQNLDFTSFTGTFAPAATLNIAGSLTIGASMTWTTGTGTINFVATSTGKTVTTAGKTLYAVTFSGTGGEWALQDAMTATNQVTLAAGTLTLNNFTLTAGQFNSSSSNTRVLAFGTTGVITCVGSGTIWNMSTVTGFSYTGTSTVNISNNSATATTVTTGSLAEATVLNFNYTTGTYVLTDTGARYKNVNWTGFAGTIGNAARQIYGNWTNPATVTFTAGASVTTFLATTGTQTFTTNTRTLDFPVTKSAAGTLVLGSALTVGSTRTFTVSAGTFTPGFDITAGLYSLTAGTINMGSVTWTASGTGAVWTRTAAVISAGTSTIALSTTTATAVTFAGGGAIYNNLSLSGVAGTGTLTITGANTFNTLASSRTGLYTITLPASTTTTISTWSVAGTNATTNYVTLNSSTAGTQATLSVATGTVNPGYAKIQDSAATGGASFTAYQASNISNNTGWSFASGVAGRYWVGGTGTWDTTATTNWSFTSGGSGGAFVPTSAEDVFFNGSSGSGTVTLTGALTAKSLDTTGSSFTFTSTGTPTVAGSMTLSATTVWSATGLITFTATGTVTTNGVTLSAPVTFNGTGITITLGSALTTTGILTLTEGTVTLNGFDLSCLTFSGTGTTARGIAFGSNYVNIISTATATVLDITTATAFTPTGAGGFKLTGAAASGITRTVVVGTTGGAVATAPNVFVAAGAAGSIFALTTASWVGDLNFTGFSGTFAPAAATTIAGSLTAVASMTWTTGTGTITFAATATGKTITLGGKSLYAVTFNGAGGGWSLQDAMTATNLLTLTAGTVTLNGFDLSCLTFSGTGTTARGIAFGSNYVNITGATTATVLDITTATAFTPTGTGGFKLTGAAASGQTRTVVVGTTGGAVATAPNVFVAAGAAGSIFALTTASWVGDLNFTGFSGTWSTSTATTTFTGSLTLVTGMTFTSGTGAWTFAGASGTQTITPAGKTFGAIPITINNTGTSVQLAGALTSTVGLTLTSGTFNWNSQTVSGFTTLTINQTAGVATGIINSASNATYTFTSITHTAGQLNLSSTAPVATSGAYSFSAGTISFTTTTTLSCLTFSSNNSNIRAIAFGTGAITTTGSGTAWNMAASGFTYTGTPTVNISNNSATATTVAMTGATATNALDFNFTTGTYALTLNTSATLKNLNFTGFTGSWAPSTATATIYGSVTMVAGMTYTTGTGLWTFAGTSGTQAITSASKTLGPLTINNAGATVQLQDNLTVNSLSTFTFTAGTLNLNNFILSIGLFSSGNANTRVIAFGTGAITTIGVGTVWSMTAATGFTYTGTPTVNISNLSGSLITVNMTGATATNALNFNFINGTYTVVLTGTYGSLNFTGYAGSTIGQTSTESATIYGNLTLSTGMTVAGTGTWTFAATTGTQLITCAGKTITQTITINNTGSSFQLQDTFSQSGTVNLTAGAININSQTNTFGTTTINGNPAVTITNGPIRFTTVTQSSGTVTLSTASFPLVVIGAYTLTAGTLDVSAYSLSTGLFLSNNSNTRVIAFGASGAITITGSGTVWRLDTVTGFSYTGTSTVNISNNSATATTVTTGALTEAQALNFNYTTGTYTLTDANAVYKNVNWTGFAGTASNQVRSIYGNWTNPSSGITWTAGANTLGFGATTGTQIFTHNAVTFDFPITQSGLGGALQLTGALTIGTTRTFTLTAGTLDLNNFTLTAGLFSSANSNTRVIAFGTTAAITVNGSGTVWTTSTTTGFSYTGTSTVNISNNSATATSVNTGILSEAQALNFNYTTGTYTLSETGGVYKNVNWTGFAGTVSNQTRTIYSNWTNPSSGITWTAGPLITTFAGTAGTQIFTTNGVTLDFPMTKSGAGTVQLAGALTVGTTRVFTLTAGTVDLTNVTLTTGQFNSNNSNTRVLAFGTSGAITTSGTGSVWNMGTVTGFTYTGTSTVNISNNSATAATVNTGILTEAQALNFNYTTGTYTLTETGGVYKNINWTGFAGTMSVARTIYGNWTNPASGGTYTAGVVTQTFAATSGTQTITTNGRTLDFPITKSNDNSTLTLGGDLTIGSSRTFTISLGTFTPGYNITAGLFSLTGTINMGSYTWTASGTGNVWSAAAGVTINAGTSTITFSDTSATAKTFVGNGKTYNNLQIGPAAGIASYVITGSNTFNTVSSLKTVGYTITLPASTTTTVSNWTAGGATPGNRLTLNSSTAGTQTTLALAGGGIAVGGDYMSIQDINFTPIASNTQRYVWYVGANSTFGTNVSGGALLASLPTLIGYLLTTGTEWTVPEDWSSYNNQINMIGGGGGGSGSVVQGPTSGHVSGSGGGGGGFTTATNVALTPGATVSYVVGSGGTAGLGTNSSSTGGNGGATTFNSGAYTAGGGGGASATISTTVGGTGGTGTTNTGGVGGNGNGTNNDNRAGGGGGGSGGESAAGGAGGNTPVFAVPGVGGAGDSNVKQYIRISTVAYGDGGSGGGNFAPGNAGSGPGSGGGGGGCASGTPTARNGGAGTPGIILIFYTQRLQIENLAINGVTIS